MSTFASQMRHIAILYMEEHDVEQIDPQLVAEWALENDLYEPQPAEVRRQFRSDLGHALRTAHNRDAQGRETRSWHVVVGQKDGVQYSLWAPGQSAPREHMNASFKQRRKRIVSNCCRLKTDVDSYNDNHDSDEKYN